MKFGDDFQNPSMKSHHASHTYFDGAKTDSYHKHFMQENMIADDDKKVSKKYDSKYGSFTNTEDKKNVDVDALPLLHATTTEHDDIMPSEWIHFRGFIKWIKKQSFIKLSYKTNEKRLRKLWHTLLGLSVIHGWKNGSIKSKNIIRV